MSKILVAGLDGSLRNFAVVRMFLDLNSGALSIDDLILTRTEGTKHKTVRKSSDSFRRASEIYSGSAKALEGCVACFAEIPFGGQSYDAVLGFGITIGVYAGLSQGVPLIEVSPNEAKLATVGTRTASKQEMIHWATSLYPAAPWRQHRGKPTLDNEHLADGCAIVHAGIKTPAFLQVKSILAATVAKAA